MNPFIFPSKKMNKATFVSEIPSKIEGNEIPTLNLVKSLISSSSQGTIQSQSQTTDINGQPVFYAIVVYINTDFKAAPFL